MTSKKQVERYEIESSPFHRIGRAKDLAELLKITPKQMKSIIVRRSALYRFKDVTIGEKKRSLAIPIGEMRALHERLKRLFGRIILPNYLYSPRKGRAAVDNALLHLDAAVIVKLDVKQFYPSTTDEHVFQFFRYRMGMVSDVAGRLVKICTINGRIPFGSPVSPILCALVHNDLFSKVATRCEFGGTKVSLWVDDLTVSGDNIARGLLKDVTRLISAKGLKAHKAQRSTARRGIVITGTYIGPNGPAPANKNHLKLQEKQKALEAETDPKKRMSLIESLIGMVNHQIAIYPKCSAKHQKLIRLRQWLWDEFRNMREAAID